MSTGEFGVGSLACFSSLDQVGEGTYGYVYRGTDKRNGNVVALKRLLFHRENAGFPLSAVREIKFLKSLQHKNIILLKDVVSSKGCEHIEKCLRTDTNRTEERGEKPDATESSDHTRNALREWGNLYLVFEYVEHDLGGLIDAKYSFSTREVKCIARQLLDVLDYLSEKKILHRDIKSSNILLTNRHQVKLADFGLARSILSSDGRELRQDLTNNVVTMWYKPPELLLGATRYNYAVDLWSTACVLAELELGRPLFPGRTEVEQLDFISKALGTPTADSCGDLKNLPNYDMLRNLPRVSNTLRTSYYGKLSDMSINLLERVLVFDPSRRASAKILLSHQYFTTQPLPPMEPTDLEPMRIDPGVSYHEYRTKQLKRQRENAPERIETAP
ncbi:kinase-like domain-containing protein [Ochromonadaceae sp. CCMP2298]|nr:kinase-like domain-containing protein [Ochromonadaceae sp. CCMP2298]|mmetsp:Transcript_12440/g.27679  ORF Transcript_12440/g.27679 Transcript_12440/m.27679 type:complete len:388 (+) Transcript_12440:93-1256(+)